MNQQFSFSRFRRLFGRHTAEYLPSYGMATVVLMGGIALVLGLVAYVQELNPVAQRLFYLMGLFAAGIIFTCGIFAQFGAAKQATVALTLPASQLEKYLVGWVYSFVIFCVVYTACFYLVDWVVVSLDDWHGRPKQLFSLFEPGQQTYAMFLHYAALHAGALWGAIYFEKNHFVKTAFVGFLLLLLLGAGHYQALQAIMGPGVKLVAPFSNVTLSDAAGSHRISVPEAQAQWLLLLPLALAGLLWRATYVRLTEKQL